jgi:hypothetical protein
MAMEKVNYDESIIKVRGKSMRIGDFKIDYADAMDLMRHTNTMLGDACLKEAENVWSVWRRAATPPSGIPTTQLLIMGKVERFRVLDEYDLERNDYKIKDFIKTFIEEIASEMDSNLLYGDEQRDRQLGLANIYNDPTKEIFNQQIIDAKGVEGDGLTSIYLMRWNEEGVFLTYPKGLEEVVGCEKGYENSIIPRYSIDKTSMEVSIGVQLIRTLVVKNPRDIVRIANIPMNKKLKEVNFATLLRDAYSKMENKSASGKTFYVNGTIYSILFDEAQKNRGDLRLKFNSKGEPDPMFRDVPIKMNDQLLSSEKQVDFDK